MKELSELIARLEQEAAAIQSQGRALNPHEIAQLRAIHQSVPLLREAVNLFPQETPAQEHLITYKIVADVNGKLKTGARAACNFWNRFVGPSYSIVIRLGVFTSLGRVIARAYKPSFNEGGVAYGRVEFNIRYLNTFTPNEIAGTIIHEIGHTLGYGWDDWSRLFDSKTGKFYETAVNDLQSLGAMEVELDGGPGTRLSHWDEDEFDRELMTGYQDSGEHVLPVTIDVMALLGHQVLESLDQQTPLSQLLDDAAQMQFARQDQAKSLDLDFFLETELLEEIPHQ